MAPAIVNKIETLWETWNIRVCILSSLIIQASLTFLAPWRKSRTNLGFVIWLLYLLADAVALYAIGLISSSPGCDATETMELLVFWSPFLLVHLGGPDTITALALEDNELWVRHLLQLATQGFGTIYLFYRSFPVSKLWVPTLIMFFDGCIKYLERTASLYLASMDSFRESLQRKPDPGPNYATLMEEYSSRRAACIPVYVKSNLEEVEVEDDDTSKENSVQNRGTNIDCENGQGGWDDIDGVALVKKAHDFYIKFRGLIADIIFTFKERAESRQFFLNTDDAKKAFNIIQIELNFIYAVFFTKMSMLQKERGITRAFTLSAVIASLLFFFFKDKHKYHWEDVCITYVLLGGAIIMDVISVIMLFFSDLAVVSVAKGAKFCFWPLTSIQRWWLQHQPRRWSKNIFQYSLLYHCLNDHPIFFKILLVNRLKDVFTNRLYLFEKEFVDTMGEHIFKELKNKSRCAKKAEDSKKACNARGDLVFSGDEYAEYSNKLQPWTLQVDYDESLLLWHIATDLCISQSTDRCNKVKSRELQFRDYSKTLSDYVMYLLIRKPAMTSAVAGIARIRFQDTCAEAKRFINRKLPPQQISKWKKLKQCIVRLFRVMSLVLCHCCKRRNMSKTKNREQARMNELCKRIFEVEIHYKPVAVKGDRSKSVLFDACQLAQTLHQLGKEKGEDVQWEVTFKVWVELLCYAASRCSPVVHVQELRQGGELITLVWLLMAHLGLGGQFRVNKGVGWAKLVSQK